MLTLVEGAKGSTPDGTDSRDTNKYKQPMTFTLRQPMAGVAELVVCEPWKEESRRLTIYSLTYGQACLLLEQLARAVTGWPR